MSNSVSYSRQGDQFHYLWAARRCLCLLSQDNDGLVTISIEGSSPDEKVTAGEDVIDMAEYFGAEDLHQARLVRYIQLKHSTKHAMQPWTASGLKKTIRGFAQRYQEHLEHFSATVLETKLQFFFVTNRPISVAFVEAVTDSANGAASRHPKELQKLEGFTGLSGETLSGFSRLLRFEDRQDDYWHQKNILFEAVTGYLPHADRDAPLALKELVIRRVLKEVLPTVTKIDVLRALNADESTLFPAPCLIVVPATPVARTQERELIGAIIAACAPIVIRAPSGVGKSVFTMRIGQGLPEGSICVPYDCYGNGLYRNASGYRHRHRDGLVQIANELAVKGFCHLLIPTFHSDARQYIQAFLHRIKQASTLLQHANPGALLCIVIDAADNAQMAAEEVGEKRSFVLDLIREKVPANVRIVFLCRPYREKDLAPPVEALSYELKPFNRLETGIRLRQVFPAASEHDVDEFHRLSSQNPRVQDFALSQGGSLTEMLRRLGPNQTSVEDTINHLLMNAVARLKDLTSSLEKAQIDRICLGLAVLRPLIPISILAQISGVDERFITSFVLDIGRPLKLAGDTLQFLDEPAETWFRKTFKPSLHEMEDYIARITPLTKTNAYAASVLPHLMLEVGKFSELVDLALNSAALPEGNPLEKRNVELQRLQFALKAALRLKRYVDAAKLAFKAGGEMAGEDRQEDIIRGNTDLAAVFLKTDFVQDIVSRRVLAWTWLGSHHAYEASLLSGRQELIGDARSHLRMAHEWLRNEYDQPSNVDPDEKISNQDIAELIMAEINIHGPVSAAQKLARWRPRDISFQVGRLVARRLIDHGRLKDVMLFIEAPEGGLCLVLGVTIELAEIHQFPPFEVTQKALRRVLKRRIYLQNASGWEGRDTALLAITALVEAALAQALCTPNEAAELLMRYVPDKPSRDLWSRFIGPRMPILHPHFLCAALQGRRLEVRDLASSEIREAMDKGIFSYDLQNFKESMGALLPWAELRASLFLGQVTKASLPEAIHQAHEISQKATQHSTIQQPCSNEIALLWMEIMGRLNALEPASLGDFLRWKKNLKSPLGFSTLTSLARHCGQREASKGLAIEFATEAFHMIKADRSDAREESEYHINLSRAILSTSNPDALEYFNEAVRIANKIGDENSSRWQAILDLATRAVSPGRPVPELAYHFSRCAELTRAYEGDDKHIDWEAMVKALCGLCPSSSLAIASRWRDRQFGWSEQILAILVQNLLDRGHLDPMDALPLISFKAEWDYDRFQERILTKCATAQERAKAKDFFDRYMQFREKRIDARRSHEHQPTPEPNWDRIFAGFDLTKADDLSSAHQAWRKSKKSPFSHFFEEAIKRLPVASETGFIQSIGDIPEFDLYDFKSFLTQIPENWKNRLVTAKALASTLVVFCRRYCMTFTRHQIDMNLASNLTGISETHIIDSVLEAIGLSPDFASYERLFSLIDLLKDKLSEDEALEVLKFGLHLFTPSLDDNDGDGPWSNALQPPSDLRASLAGYIWATLAAPESALRWEGAHALVGLVHLERRDVLRSLFHLAATQKGGPFVDATLRFYDLHALQWFLIGIDRAAQDRPEELAPYLDQILNWALEGSPHVLIRQFSARTAVTLINAGIGLDRDNLRQRLSRINKTPFPMIESKSYERVPYSGMKGPYLFDYEIANYWFEPLGRVFAFSTTQIDDHILHVMKSHRELALSHDNRLYRSPYKKYRTLSSHGSYPYTDNAEFYRAYHLMMITAGHLLASTPVHRDPDYAEDDEFAYWLGHHDLTRNDGRWLWDRRDPPPPEQYSWQNRKGRDAAFRKLTIADFDESLHAESMLNIWGDWRMTDAELLQSTFVYSALVDPKQSLKILKQLKKAESPYHYTIPRYGTHMDHNDPGFPLEGWIAEDDFGDSKFDALDRWAGGIAFSPPKPADSVIKRMGLRTDRDLRFWQDQTGTLVMASQVWGHYDENLRHETHNPESGRRLQASMDFLKMLLKKLKRDMIIRVQIRRCFRNTREVEEVIPATAKLYLLRADGQLRMI